MAGLRPDLAGVGNGSTLLDLQRVAGNRAVATLLMVQRDATCPPRTATEVTESRSAGGLLSIDAAYIETDRAVEVSDFPVGSAALPQDFLTTAPWQRAFSIMRGDPSVRLAVTGFTDCVGAGHAAEDFGLRQRRADALVAALPPDVRAKVLFSRPEFAGTYLATNTSPEGRARNRGARITYTATDPRKNPGELVPKATNLDEYLFLVRSLERKLSLTTSKDAATALSVLRQIYYGSASWSSHKESMWDKVITQRPWSPGTDPTPTLGLPLMKALKASQVVEGADVGHTFTGLDAMMKPGTADLPGVLTSTIQNEALATWSGDVGSAAAEWAADMYLGTKKGDARFHFTNWAGDSDLVGDVDAFAIRSGFNGGSPPGQVGQALKLRGPLSDILLDYHRTTSTTFGVAHADRIRTFVLAFGGKVAGSRVTNPGELRAALYPQVSEFAIRKIQYKMLQPGWSPPADAPELREAWILAARTMCHLFVEWLDSRLAAP